MEEKKPYFLTTAIAYASGRPHIGNSYEIIFSDALARFKRAQGYDVFFQTGTDEHGIKIEEKAAEQNMSPKEFVDEKAADIKNNWDLLNTSYDYFIRTTDEQHEKAVQKIFKKLYEQGDIYKGEYEGWYCTPCESFWTESQLQDGKCPDCGRDVQKAKEEAYFFDMKKYADWLMDYINEHPDFILPESRKNEMVRNFLEPGLQDLCVSRTSFKWGIPVDFDPDHVVYVWLDALTNYITSLGYDPEAQEQSEMFKKYWPADHIIGKDILRFHTIYWPIFLKALGLEMPNHVFGHPWLLVSEGKMSKSKGNVIYAEDLVKHFGVDGVRYFALHEMPYANDGTISWELITERNNADLANNLGNLYSRVLSMAHKYFDGLTLPPVAKDELDDELAAAARKAYEDCIRNMEEFRVSAALESIFVFLRRANKYIDETTPWVLAKDEAQKERLQTVIYNLLESLRIAAVLLESFLPETSQKILDGLHTEKRSLESAGEFGQLELGVTVDKKPEPLFKRIDLKALMEELEAEKEEIPSKPEVAIEDFDKLELKVGKILSARKHKKSKRLMVEEVDLGHGDVRQIVSSIAEVYKPEDLKGKKVIVVTNLKEIKLKGERSQGMLLCADDPLRVVFVEDAIEEGSIIR